MCEGSERKDPLREAAFEALKAADNLAEAIKAVEAAGALTREQLEQLRDLRPASLMPPQITREAVDALRGLAESLEPSIKGETMTWFVHDEHDMSDGYEDSETSDAGFTLIRLRSALQNLAERLMLLRNWQEAERIAQQLRS
jgi:hypothetical protein